MVSESARMSSAAETRFRVQAPNSRPRSTKVIALDAAGGVVVRRLSALSWQRATFFTAHVESLLHDLEGHSKNLSAEIDDADLVVMVAGPGGEAHAAASIGQACSRRSVMTTALVIGANAAPDIALSKTLAQLRPWSLMVVIAKGDEYIDDIMTALRA